MSQSNVSELDMILGFQIYEHGGSVYIRATGASPGKVGYDHVLHISIPIDENPDHPIVKLWKEIQWNKDLMKKPKCEGPYVGG